MRPLAQKKRDIQLFIIQTIKCSLKHDQKLHFFHCNPFLIMVFFIFILFSFTCFCADFSLAAQYFPDLDFELINCVLKGKI